MTKHDNGNIWQYILNFWVVYYIKYNYVAGAILDLESIFGWQRKFRHLRLGLLVSDLGQVIYLN